MTHSRCCLSGLICFRDATRMRYGYSAHTSPLAPCGQRGETWDTELRWHSIFEDLEGHVHRFNWSPGIGDPTFMGWLTVVLYLLTAWFSWQNTRCSPSTTPRPAGKSRPGV